MSRSSRRGLSLIEVLVVLGVIALLFSMLVPATRRVGQAAHRAHCSNNLKQLVLAMHNYHDTTGYPVPLPSMGPPNVAVQWFPPGCLGPGAAPEERLSWMVALLPYIEREDLFRRFDPKTGYAGNLPAAQAVVKTLRCPAAKDAPTDPVTHYVAMAGIGADAAGRPAGGAGNGFMGFDRKTSMAAIADGTSNTIALMETRSGLGPWARGGGTNLRGFDPNDLPLHGDDRPFGGHKDGMNAAMADGSVRFLSASVDPARLAAAITIAGGEKLDLD